MACVLTVPGVSFGQAMVAPGAAPANVRAVEWVRDHGGGGIVDRVENWWYARHIPAGAVPTAASSATTAAGGAGGRSGGMVGPVMRVSARPAQVPAIVSAPTVVSPQEGRWIAGRPGSSGAPALYTTYFRPDPAHPGVIAAAAWVRAGSYSAHLVAGTTQPDGATWPGEARVAPSDVADLLATFNAGFKFKDTPGGFYLDGRSARPLQDGLATAVIDDTGRLQVGTYGSQVTVGPHTRGARQNLQLIVDSGAPVPGLHQNSSGRWGTSRNQGQFTWRSALGTDAQGDLIYVGGNGLDLVHLADALVIAGAVRGMELDMHQGMVSFSSWMPVAGSGTPQPTKLLPDMTRQADRYLAADQRDFFYLTVR